MYDFLSAIHLHVCTLMHRGLNLCLSNVITLNQQTCFMAVCYLFNSHLNVIHIQSTASYRRCGEVPLVFTCGARSTWMLIFKRKGEGRKILSVKISFALETIWNLRVEVFTTVKMGTECFFPETLAWTFATTRCQSPKELQYYMKLIRRDNLFLTAQK
jgi:hypothetical protein